MRTSSAARQLADDDVFSVDEIARAAGVPAKRVSRLLPTGGVHEDYIRRIDAIRLVRTLSGGSSSRGATRNPLTVVPETRRAQGVPLLMSGATHAAMLLVILFLTSGWFDAQETEQQIIDPQPVRLVFLMTRGSGGGGGGGGMKMPIPPARAERRIRPKAVKSPVPPARKAPPPPVSEPPKPAEPPKIDPPPVEPPRVDPPKPDPPKPPPQTVQAPVVASAADAANRTGVLDRPPSSQPSAGPGSGGGAGAGTGGGIGEGRGGGIGPGEGGGIGGVPFQPGAGIEPPTLLREVKPVYTDEARKRSLEGAVLLDVVVRRDGSVGSVRTVRKLGAGLDERAIEAVRQWRFAPARRHGSPVDVVVEISVEFTLR